MQGAQLGKMRVSLLVVALLFAIASPTQQLREDLNFNFGWRFSIGYKIQCPADEFTSKLNDVQCDGLLPLKNRLTTQDECRDACCEDVLCVAWQYSKKGGCNMGQYVNDCSKKSEGMVGERRAEIPASLPPAGKGPGEKTFDDSSWVIVDLPHDGIINGTFDQTNLESHGYLPLNTTWYRKHFNLPMEWKGQSVWVYFEGVFRASVTYLNGEPIYYQDSGYTSFAVRLDNISSLSYGDGKENENVITVKASSGGAFSGHWYEGGGIYRPTHLISTDPVHFVPDGVYGASQIIGSVSDHDSQDPSKGQYADVEFNPVAEVINSKSTQVEVMVKFDIFDEEGQSAASIISKPVTIDPGKSKLVNVTISKTANIELWSITRPYLYKLEASLMTASGQPPMDNVSIPIGARLAHWDPNVGFSLNGKHFIWRGFNNHNDFTGVGAAVPDRVNLFRGQMMRAVGANSWRMSHNPPVPAMLDILDRIGIAVWDENRLMGNNSHWIQNQRNMVRRDRNHPSIMIWSFCNEGECRFGYDEAVAEVYRIVSKEADPYRPVSANMVVDEGNDLSKVLDVQGFSHRSGSVFDSYHKLFPYKPLLGSECCSCRTQRGEDIADSKKPVFGAFNADCNQQQTENQLNRKFVSGCVVWTLFDYYGEPSPYGWPMVVGSFGSIDVAGFPKPSAYWYRTWWYYSAKSNVSDGGYDVPINPPPLADPYATTSQENSKEGYAVYIVQGWEDLPNVSNRTVQAYTNAPMAELTVNGKSQGIVKVDWQGWAQWDGITFSPGKITANALDSQKQVKATHTVETSGNPTKVVLTVDAPSEVTGTGVALVLDGQDAGMVSAAVVDSNRNVVRSFSDKVTFRVVSGPGRIIGVGNGDPACHEPNQVSWISAYHGLARVIVQTSENAATSPHLRRRMTQVDRDGGIRTRIVPPDDTSPRADAIILEASVKGLESAKVSIPVSTDAAIHGVLAAAKWSITN